MLVNGTHVDITAGCSVPYHLWATVATDDAEQEWKVATEVHAEALCSAFAAFSVLPTTPSRSAWLVIPTSLVARMYDFITSRDMPPA